MGDSTDPAAELTVVIEHLAQSGVAVTGHGENLAAQHVEADAVVESAVGGWRGQSAQAAQDAADGIASLPASSTWGGVAADAAKASPGRTHLDLTVRSNSALAVAAAARTAAENIEKLQVELKRDG